MTIDNATIAGVASTVLLLIGGMVTAAIRWANARARQRVKEVETKAATDREALAAQSKAVRELLSDIIGPPGEDPDGSGSWMSQSGRFQLPRRNANTPPHGVPAVDQSHVEEAIARIEGTVGKLDEKIDKLNEKWEAAFGSTRDRVERHRVRIALLEQAAGVRRQSSDTDSDRPGR